MAGQATSACQPIKGRVEQGGPAVGMALEQTLC